jgi:hypothetical protein
VTCIDSSVGSTTPCVTSLVNGFEVTPMGGVGLGTSRGCYIVKWLVCEWDEKQKPQMRALTYILCQHGSGGVDNR